MNIYNDSILLLFLSPSPKTFILVYGFLGIDLLSGSKAA